MEQYVVTCANPPAELKVEEGDEVLVQGTKLGEKITAKSIRNITKNSAKCGCETGIGIMVLPEEVEADGLARNISITSGYLQFTLEARSVKKSSLQQSSIPIHP
jgi:hypothetical protein